MSARSYAIGLPVVVTVRDDGGISVEVDMSEATTEISDVWHEADEETYPEVAAIDERQMLMDVAIVGGHHTRSSAATTNIQAGALGEMNCPVRWSCPFRTSQLHEMAAHITDGEHE